MKLKVLAFGRLKFPGYRAAADEYLKRLQPWVSAQEIELKPTSVPDKSDSTRLRIQTVEGKLLLEKTKAAHLVLLDETGRSLKTQEWAQRVRDWESSGSDVVVAVGSSLGWSPEVRAQAHEVLSLGPQTLPHELARVVLLEQLYRAFSVVRGHPYHNEG